MRATLSKMYRLCSNYNDSQLACDIKVYHLSLSNEEFTTSGYGSTILVLLSFRCFSVVAQYIMLKTIHQCAPFTMLGT